MLKSGTPDEWRGLGDISDLFGPGHIDCHAFIENHLKAHSVLPSLTTMETDGKFTFDEPPEPWPYYFSRLIRRRTTQLIVEDNEEINKLVNSQKLDDVLKGARMLIDKTLKAITRAASVKALAYAGCVVSAPALLEMDIPERENFIGGFIRASSLNMLSAPRGTGKTWAMLQAGLSLTSGQDYFGCWTVPKPRRVLFVDGEMPAADLKANIAKLDQKPPEMFTLLLSQMLHEKGLPRLNLNDKASQDIVMGRIDDAKPDVVIFDNLSSLCAGRDENDNSQLDGFLSWLVELRHRGLAVILVHHLGKDHQRGPRGASRIEDLLDTSIQLEEIKGHEGAAFKITFIKTRGEKPSPQCLSVRLRSSGNDGLLYWDYVDDATNGNGHLLDNVDVAILGCVQNGITSPTEIAVKIGKGKDYKGSVSKKIDKLVKHGHLSDDKPPKITAKGVDYLDTGSGL
jgi:hypothetical protein